MIGYSRSKCLIKVIFSTNEGLWNSKQKRRKIRIFLNFFWGQDKISNFKKRETMEEGEVVILHASTEGDPTLQPTSLVLSYGNEKYLSGF